MRDAACELHHLDTALNVAARIRNGLAVLGRKQFGECVEFFLYQLEKLEHDARAALRIRSGPAGLRPLRIGNGMRNLGLFGERDLGLDLACIGVENVAEATGGSLNGFAAYKMANLTHGSHSSDF